MGKFFSAFLRKSELYLYKRKSMYYFRKVSTHIIAIVDRVHDIYFHFLGSHGRNIKEEMKAAFFPSFFPQGHRKV